MQKILDGYKQAFLATRWYLFFVVGLCAIWTVVGVILVLSFPALLPYLLVYLQKTFQSIFGDIETLPRLSLAWALFRQNAIASLYDLFLGLAFGILPIFSIAFNFFTLGFLLAPSLAPTVFSAYPASIGVFLLGILPHGIFELPAFMIASAFGIRLGWEWLLPRSAGQRAGVFRASLADAIKMVPLILALLAIAAFVESFVTSQLI